MSDFDNQKNLKILIKNFNLEDHQQNNRIVIILKPNLLKKCLLTTGQ